MDRYRIEIFTEKNTKAEDKPNEDLAIFDASIEIGMVLDGVSRDRENGLYPDPSPAEVASRLFAETVLRTAKTCPSSGIEKLQQIVCSGNHELSDYNDILQHRFPAGTVGLVFTLERDRFHYAYIGDCYAAVIRNGMMRIFTECQTSMVTKYKKQFTSDEIRFEICNHISHPCGYGVWDGNDEAMDFVKYGTIQLKSGDTLLIYSDGMVDEIETKDVHDLQNETLASMISPKVYSNGDDRTCMRISVL